MRPGPQGVRASDLGGVEGAARVMIVASGMFRLETSRLSGDMGMGRSGHQATLLLDGRVLVTGGSDERGQAMGGGQGIRSRRGTDHGDEGTWSVAPTCRARGGRDAPGCVIAPATARPRPWWCPSSTRR
jgi:hypothetical protein